MLERRRRGRKGGGGGGNGGKDQNAPPSFLVAPGTGHYHLILLRLLVCMQIEFRLDFTRANLR